MAETNISE